MFGTAVRRVAALAVFPLLVACGDDDPVGPGLPEEVEFAPSLGVDLEQMTRLDSGVYYSILEQGAGIPVASGEVNVNYTLWLSDGTEIESGNLDFNIGAGQVIPGFDQGVSGMRVGEIRLIVIPSELGYGTQGTGSIPPNAVLVFRVELVSETGPA